MQEYSQGGLEPPYRPPRGLREGIMSRVITIGLICILVAIWIIRLTVMEGY